MPLEQYHIISPHTRLGIWRIAESEAFFTQYLQLSEADNTELSSLQNQRRMEWLAGKYLVRLMTGFGFPIVKDAFGKPHLEGSNGHISLSHSGDFAVAIVSSHAVGIDIQVITPKLEGVARRVLNEDKFKYIEEPYRLEHLHVYWCAKEALYKAYGQKGLNFKENIRVLPFNFGEILEKKPFFMWITEGVVETIDFKKTYDIYFHKIENCILVYVVAQNPSSKNDVLNASI